MNKKGFTLVELLATLVILGIVMGIVLLSTTSGLGNAKNKTEDVFVKTIRDALEIYLDSDARSLNYDTQVCEINKTHKKGVKVYKADKDKDGNYLTFMSVINSSYKPITEVKMINPANKDVKCNVGNKNGQGTLTVYRDEDYVYYYKIDKSSFDCLMTSGVITNLPNGCNG